MNTILRILLPAALLAAPALRADLIAHYDFETVNEDNGVFATDEVTSGGTDYATAGSRGVFDQNCRRLGTRSLVLADRAGDDTNGDDGAVSSNSFDWSTSDKRTVAFWMKASSTQTDPYPTMISLGAEEGNFKRFDIRLNGGNLRVEIQGSGFTTSSALADDTWHHIAVVVPDDDSTLADVKYYIDGAYVGNISGGASIETAVGPLRMGDSFHGSFRDFTGAIDDVRLYDEVLDDAAIQSLYDDGVANLPTILCYWSSSPAIAPGDSIDLNWEINPAATAASIDNGVGDILSLTTDGLGSTTVSPTSTTTYTLTVNDGTTNSTLQVTVRVVSGEIQIADVSFAGGEFSLTVEGLLPSRTYNFVYTADIADWDTDTGKAVVLATFTANATGSETLVDLPPDTDPTGFYRVEEAPAP
jgi:hypothetical protein